jgi:hypothetical protein
MSTDMRHRASASYVKMRIAARAGQQFKISPICYSEFQKNMPGYFENPGRCIKY